MQLKDRMVVVTDAACGIGQEFCLASACGDAGTVVAANLHSCEETVNKVKETGDAALGVVTDVSKQIIKRLERPADLSLAVVFFASGCQ
jgi:NAD(P)-dependent dehydrogenase (short-subunit alcohol dehydrogenase family)